MLLQELYDLHTVQNIRHKLISIQLDESITDYFAVQLSKLRNKSGDELFTGSDKLDVEELAKIITGLKVLSNKEYRSAMTRDDIGIQPNSAKELFKFLNTVDKGGKNPKDVEETFNALKQLAPSTYRRELETLEKLKHSDTSKKQEALNKLIDLSKRVGEMFTKLKSAAAGNATPSQTAELRQKMAKA